MRLIAIALLLICLTTAITLKDGSEKKIHQNRAHTLKHRDEDAQQQQESDNQQQQQQEDSEQQQQEGDSQQQQQQEGDSQQQQQQEDSQQQQEGDSQQQQQQQEGDSQQQQQQQEGDSQQQQQEGDSQQQQQEAQQEGDSQQQQEDDSQQQQQQEGDSQQQQQQEGDSQQQQQEDSQQQQQEDSSATELKIHAKEGVYLEVFVDGEVKPGFSMPKLINSCKTKNPVRSTEKPKEPCHITIEGEHKAEATISIDKDPETIVVHAFSPKSGSPPFFKFEGGESMNSNSKNWECAKNWAAYWKDGKTIAPNYKPAVEEESEEATDEKSDKAAFIWVKDSNQHHITCVWTKQTCLKSLGESQQESGGDCELSSTRGAKFDSERYNIAPKISAEAGEHPKGSTPAYDTVEGLGAVKDVEMKDLGNIDTLLENAQEQHEDLAGSVAKACKGPLCAGIYSL